MAKSPNRLLAALPAETFAAVQPHLKIVELKPGDVIAETGSAGGNYDYEQRSDA